MALSIHAPFGLLCDANHGYVGVVAGRHAKDPEAGVGTAEGDASLHSSAREAGTGELKISGLILVLAVLFLGVVF